MRKYLIIIILWIFAFQQAYSGRVTKTYYFNDPVVKQTGNYSLIWFEGCRIFGKEGNASLPFYPVKLLLPPGEIAASINIEYQDEEILPGSYTLMPKQATRPVSEGISGKWLMDSLFYASSSSYPDHRQPEFYTHFMNGFGIVLSSFTPLQYVPSTGKVSYFKKIRVTVETSKDPEASKRALNYHGDPDHLIRLAGIVQNFDMLGLYPARDEMRSGEYDGIVITKYQFKPEFDTLVNFYKHRGYVIKTATIEHIDSVTSGMDQQQRIRNYIIGEYQNHDIGYVLLGGDVEVVPYRGFYCTVLSGGSYYTDYGIPADLYYSSLDGTWDNDNDGVWGEPGEDDLYPEVAVGRLPFSDTAELHNMLHKTFSYQASPVQGELTHPLMAGEHLWSDPDTWGSDYLHLLVGYHTDNGYTTRGIPPEQPIDSLYDEHGWWSAGDLMAMINSGKPWLHHVGHSNYTYLMKMDNSDITNANFYGANGINHNYTVVYTHGCMCGGFDQSDCIAEKMVSIDNFAVAFIGNSRYGWFDEGTTDGPSEHLHREFIDALYRDSLYQAGKTLMRSKSETAPFVTMGEYETGATRWCFYDNNLLGDPFMAMWTEEPHGFSAQYDSLVSPGSDSLVVQLSGLGLRFEGFRCSILQNNQILGYAATDSSGRAAIHLNNSLVCGVASMIVSGYNILTHQFPILVGNEWLGYTTDWSNPVNWCLGSVPDSNSFIVIPNNPIGGNHPTTNSGNPRCCRAVVLEPGASLIIKNGETFSVHGN